MDHSFDWSLMSQRSCLAHWELWYICAPINLSIHNNIGCNCPILQSTLTIICNPGWLLRSGNSVMNDKKRYSSYSALSMPPFKFIPNITGHCLTLLQPNSPFTFVINNINLNWSSILLLDVAVIENWNWGGIDSPAAVLPVINDTEIIDLEKAFPTSGRFIPTYTNARHPPCLPDTPSNVRQVTSFINVDGMIWFFNEFWPTLHLILLQNLIPLDHAPNCQPTFDIVVNCPSYSNFLLPIAFCSTNINCCILQYAFE